MKRTILILSGIAITLFLSIFVLYKNNQSSNEEVVEIFKEESIEKEVEEDNIIKEKVRVDIKGMVSNPGVYEVDSNLSVSDVISLAGGLLENANTNLINLAKKVYDEMIIIIYSNEEVESQKENKECLCDCLLIDNNACFDKEDNISNETSLININTASIDNLMKINGIGEAKAKSIIDYRNKNGNFKSIEDIKNVPGIGDSLFEKIKEYITV